MTVHAAGQHQDPEAGELANVDRGIADGVTAAARTRRSEPAAPPAGAARALRPEPAGAERLSARPLEPLHRRRRTQVAGYVNLDLFPCPAWTWPPTPSAALPRRPVPTRRVRRRARARARSRAGDARDRRVLAPGGYAHLVTPFCHPFHEYPKDYRRFTLDGLKEMAGGLEVVAEGWRTGPDGDPAGLRHRVRQAAAALALVARAAHGVLGWLLFPLRYLDLWLLRSPPPAGSATTAISG